MQPITVAASSSTSAPSAYSSRPEPASPFVNVTTGLDCHLLHQRPRGGSLLQLLRRHVADAGDCCVRLVDCHQRVTTTGTGGRGDSRRRCSTTSSSSGGKRRRTSSCRHGPPAPAPPPPPPRPVPPPPHAIAAAAVALVLVLLSQWRPAVARTVGGVDRRERYIARLVRGLVRTRCGMPRRPPIPHQRRQRRRGAALRALSGDD
jgi:hypothetical protein